MEGCRASEVICARACGVGLSRPVPLWIRLACLRVRHIRSWRTGGLRFLQSTTRTCGFESIGLNSADGCCEILRLCRFSSSRSSGRHMGGCQNYGPFLGTLNNRCRIIIGTQRGTLILTTTHIQKPFQTVSSLSLKPLVRENPSSQNPKCPEPASPDVQGNVTRLLQGRCGFLVWRVRLRLGFRKWGRGPLSPKPLN